MDSEGVTVRRAELADFDGWFDVFEAVAAEGKWIGRELPIDKAVSRDGFVARFVDATPPGLALLALADGRGVGHLGMTLRSGIADFGMAILLEWRGRGVGTALLGPALEWAGAQGAHKVTLQLWPHNVAARRLYEKFGFVEEGYLHRQYRRSNGELWDAIVMGRVLDTTSPGSPW